MKTKVLQTATKTTRRGFFVLLAAVIATPTALAHSGRTNKRGCHKQRGYGKHCH